jgi:ABC-type bacteriocin/lantibiotic exporter with double-glycine peptidase domain
MGRSKVTAIQQPNDHSCGPSALKTALKILDIRSCLSTLTKICKTNGNGTSTKNLISGINKLGLQALSVEHATLQHLQGALKSKPGHNRAIMVNYLYDYNDQGKFDYDSGHWAIVSAYSASKSRIYILDSYSGKKISYPWSQFRKRWIDFDLKRKRINTANRKFKIVKKWLQQLMVVIAKDERDLPKFKSETAKLYLA